MVLTLIDIRKIESYLAIKYGITLNTNDGADAGDYLNSSGTKIWEASSDASAFHNYIFGLFRDDTSTMYQKQSLSTEINNGITIYNGSGYAGIFPISIH